MFHASIMFHAFLMLDRLSIINLRVFLLGREEAIMEKETCGDIHEFCVSPLNPTGFRELSFISVSKTLATTKTMSLGALAAGVAISSSLVILISITRAKQSLFYYFFSQFIFHRSTIPVILGTWNAPKRISVGFENAEIFVIGSIIGQSSFSMEYSNAFSFLIIALSYNETIIGKIWLAVVIFLRFMVIFLAAYPLYQDEQERFICNTLQPGCSNVCYDLFAPVSHFRFWLIHSMSVLLPYVVFGVCILHGVVRHIVKASSSPYSQYKEIKPLSGCKITKDSKSSAKKRKIGRRNEMAALDFSRAYIVHLIMRILIEAGFGTGQYYLFGVFVPKRFSCDRFPCMSFVDCYISRPTEKTIMMLFIWGLGGFSFLLSLVDLIFALRTSGLRNRRNKLLLQKFNAEEEGIPDLQQDDHPGNIHHGSMPAPEGGMKCLLACKATEDCPFPPTMTLQQIIGSHLNSNQNKVCNESSNQDLLFNEAKQRENPSEQSRHEHQSYFVKEPLAFKSQEVCHHSSHSFTSYDKPSVHYSTLERKSSDTPSVCDSSEYSKSKKSEWV